MKRLPHIFSFFTGLALCLTLAFWGGYLLTASKNNGTVFAAQAYLEPVSGHWGNLFGRSQTAHDSASNYQLKGVVVAPSAQDSAAIISIDGKPAQSLHVHQELMSGVRLNEVHQTYVVINELGAEKRINLALSASAPMLNQHEVGEGSSSRPKSVEERSRRAPIALPETTVAEVPFKPGRAEQKSSSAELPTASYTALKMP